MRSLNPRGVSLVLVAIAMFVILILAGMAIDLAYIFFIKNEMQVAVDASALAGAGEIGKTDDLVQTAAIARAIEFAGKNQAGGDPVVPDTITFGFWNAAVASAPVADTAEERRRCLENIAPSNYMVNTTPINAVRVRAQKSGLLFLGKLIDWPSMTACADAIAVRPPEPTTAMSVCIRSCVVNTPITFYFKEQQSPVPPEDQTIAWSEFNCDRATDLGPNSLIAQYVRGDISPPNVCDKCITTNNSHGTVVLKLLEEEYNEQKDPSTNLWRVLVPVVNGIPSEDSCPNCRRAPSVSNQPCPPGDQPDEPFLVTRYAVMNISAVYSPPERPRIDVHSIGCVDCPATELLGRSTGLVE